MLGLLHKEVNGESLDAHITKHFDMDEAAEGMSKRLSTSTSFMAPIATFVRNFVRCKMDTATEAKK